MGRKGGVSIYPVPSTLKSFKYPHKIKASYDLQDDPGQTFTQRKTAPASVCHRWPPAS